MSISYRPAGALPAALAALAAISAVPASAAVINVSVNTPVGAGATYVLDVKHDGGSDAQIRSDYNAAGGTASVWTVGNVELPVAAGTSIGPNSFVSDPKLYTYGNRVDTSSTSGRTEHAIGDNLYLPFNFLNGSVTNYGWLDLSIHNPNLPGAPVSAPYQVTVNAYGYDNTGASVLAAGAATTSVPEPSSLLLLAAGFAGFSAMRRKSRAAAFTA